MMAKIGTITWVGVKGALMVSVEGSTVDIPVSEKSAFIYALWIMRKFDGVMWYYNGPCNV